VLAAPCNNMATKPLGASPPRRRRIPYRDSLEPLSEPELMAFAQSPAFTTARTPTSLGRPETQQFLLEIRNARGSPPHLVGKKEPAERQGPSGLIALRPAHPRNTAPREGGLSSQIHSGRSARRISVAMTWKRRAHRSIRDAPPVSLLTFCIGGWTGNLRGLIQIVDPIKSVALVGSETGLANHPPQPVFARLIVAARGADYVFFNQDTPHIVATEA
jgi:hypothetical protein